MVSRNGTRALLLGLLALLLLPASALAAPALSGEFEVSGLDNNNKIVEGPDGNIWVTLFGTAKNVARIAPKSGAVEEFELGVNGPSGIASAAGKLWITEGNGVTSFSPSDPEGTKETTAIAAIAGNHSIVAGPDGNLWVATNEKLLRFPPGNTAAIEAGLKEIPKAGMSPRDIDVAGASLAIADFAGARVLTATPAAAANGEFAEFALIGGAQGVAGAPNGQLGFSQQGQQPEQLGLLTPPGPPLLTEVSATDPFGAAFGSDGAFWIAQPAGDHVANDRGTVARLSADNHVTVLQGFAANSRPRQIAGGPDNTMWVTLPSEGGASKVARIGGLEPPKPTSPPPPLPPPGARTEPQTTIVRGPKRLAFTTTSHAMVRFVFTSPDAGARFECRLVTLGPRRARASKATPFAPCRSPKAYHPKPGRYRFEVRAVLAGVPDATPAKRAFRVVRIGVASLR